MIKRRIVALVLCLCLLAVMTGCAAIPPVVEPSVEPELQVNVEADKQSTETKLPITNTSVSGTDKKEPGTKVDVTNGDPVVDKNNNQSSNVLAPNGEYNEGVVLVKVEDTFTAAALGDLSYTSVEPLYKGSKWYAVRLAEGVDTVEAANYLSGLSTIEKADFDYVMAVGTDGEAKVTDNPNYNQQTNLGVHNIPNGWTQNGKYPGGSADVIVAVIDTGVDYNHLDLRNNIWVNSAEIPGNGVDDDGNGYIDDVYGWDCVGDDNDPMDDNGHGTHVAGIIAAENNKIGGIGVAYNCKVMVLKAGNSSGYFNNSDIAEAIQYAYMNGASVINMSFGGSNISVAVEDALENAYNSCVLVAAAGNDGACNNLACEICDIKKVSYPAALPYVIGVMSTDATGSRVSSFSNFDHNPYNTVEYEVYAVGEAVSSTWPGNKYASLNGTSMAAPTVSGIAALLRSAFPDREVYSTKYIQSQIVNTGTVNSYNYNLEDYDDAHSVADVYEALTKLPKPDVNLYDYRIDDNASINAKNNGNGVIDAGETVRLYVSLHNRGGVASNVNVSIDTERSEGLTDPYFTFVNPTMQLSDIGTYSVRESGDKYFEIVVDADCPNDYLVDFNIRYTYKNDMDEKDNTDYSGQGVAQFNVSSGWHLPETITEDTVFKADRLYIVGQDVVIPAGVTVTFEEGCKIQFYDDRTYYRSPKITVYGTLNILGTKDSMVKIYPSERHAAFAYGIRVLGDLKVAYADIVNAVIGVGDSRGDFQICVNDSYIRTNSSDDSYMFVYSKGEVIYIGITTGYYFDIEYSYPSLSEFTTYNNNYIESMYYGFLLCNLYNNFLLINNTSQYYRVSANNFANNIIVSKDVSSYNHGITIENEGTNSLFIAEKSLDVVPLEFKSPTNSYDNEFSTSYQQKASQIIKNYYDTAGNPIIDVNDSLADPSVLWPYVVSVEMFNKDGEPITTVGKEEIKVRVTFNRPMDRNAGTFLTFGTIEPYADYRIDGKFVSDTVWEGTYTLKAQIENGQNFLKVNNAWAAEDPTKTVFGEYQLHEFTIDTTAAMAMNLQAIAKDNGIELTFAQDDYDTLLGYNIYRSEEKDGNFVKLNSTIVLPEENTFLDDNAEPGKTYWYTYTVVLSDFTESNPAGKVQATAKDTMAPSLYHTPVNQGYVGNNLVISCTASDNMQIANVTLYYRTVGSGTWKTLTMSKVNDKYNATVFGSELSLAGLEYYIVAFDGVNTVSKGTADAPYTVVIKDASSVSRLGDVDGNGSVTTKDALMLMQCLNGDLILADDAFKRADLNGDNVLSSAEALRILQYVNGKLNTLTM